MNTSGNILGPRNPLNTKSKINQSISVSIELTMKSKLWCIEDVIHKQGREELRHVPLYLHICYPSWLDLIVPLGFLAVLQYCISLIWNSYKQLIPLMSIGSSFLLQCWKNTVVPDPFDEGDWVSFIGRSNRLLKLTGRVKDILLPESKS